ncbi:hypothetical protein KR009_002285 [Drosophila setifemur]|nr:hypothetical protein KR009_002285 [Drosophila setifemur]
MSNKEGFQRFHKNWTQVANRLFFKVSAWIIYVIAIVCHFLKLKYDSQKNKVEERKYNRLWSKIIVSIKILLIGSQYLVFFVLTMAIYIHFRLVDSNKAQNFVMGLFVQGIDVCALWRLVVFLHFKKDRRFVMNAVNEMLQITSIIEQKFGIIYNCHLVLVAVYACKLWLLYTMLESFLDKSYFLLFNFLYWVLLEFCFVGYFIYQILLLNWLESIVTYLHGFIEDHRDRLDVESHYQRKLFLLFKLHLRINSLHTCINDNLTWFSTYIFLMIFTSIFNMELFIECSLYGEDELENKIYIITDGCLGPMLIPILSVLILGMCTDRFRNAELNLQQQIVIIHSLYLKKPNSRVLIKKILDNEHTSLIIYQKLEPLQNGLLLGTTCDRQFAFDYILTIILTALSLVQYTIAGDEPINECVTHK